MSETPAERAAVEWPTRTRAAEFVRYNMHLLQLTESVGTWEAMIADLLCTVVRQEREACAEIAATEFILDGWHPAAKNAAIAIAAAIRERT